MKNIINLGEKINHFIIPEYLTGRPIIDAGANIGNVIKKLRGMGVTSLIIAIEACATNVSILQEQCFDGVNVLQKAMVGSKHPKTVNFTEIEGLSEWGSVTDINTYKARAAANVKKRYLVPTITLPELCEQLDIIDYLKMDIEGSESDVVHEMTPEIAQKIRQLSIEVHNNDRAALENKLQSLGYVTTYLHEDIYGIRSDII